MSKEKRFSQEEVNKIVQERLERYKRKTAEEIEQVRSEVPEGETDYKALYEKALKEKEAFEQQQAKEQALLDVGFTYEQVPDYLKYLDKVSEDEYAETAQEFYDAYQAKLGNKSTYADPSQGAKRRKWNPFS